MSVFLLLLFVLCSCFLFLFVFLSHSQLTHDLLATQFNFVLQILFLHSQFAHSPMLTNSISSPLFRSCHSLLVRSTSGKFNLYRSSDLTFTQPARLVLHSSPSPSADQCNSLTPPPRPRPSHLHVTRSSTHRSTVFTLPHTHVHSHTHTHT